MSASLRELLDRLARAAPSERIKLRDAVLAYGSACVDPLMALAGSRPDLSAQVVAWLAELVARDPAAAGIARSALRRLAGRPDGTGAQQALDRLGGVERAAASSSGRRVRTGPKVRRDAGAEVHARLIAAAKIGRVLTYGELETSRGHVGKYLLRISQEESAAGHPPLTAIVVSKSTRRPGDGFLPAMIEVGFAHPGESMDEVWPRAVAAVHGFWAGRP